MISTQFIKSKNAMINEDIVTARIVNMQTMEFDEWCDQLADGSTVTAADVSAVMKQIEKRLPAILSLNTKVECSPEGLIFRPKVSGSITQSQLKAKKAAETDPGKAALIDVNRAITTSDLSVSDCTVSIVVDLPKSWSVTFQQKARLKRVSKASTEVEQTATDGADDLDDTTSNGAGSGSDIGNTSSGETGSTLGEQPSGGDE